MFKERFIAWGKENEKKLKVERALERIIENSKNRGEIDTQLTQNSWLKCFTGFALCI